MQFIKIINLKFKFKYINFINLNKYNLVIPISLILLKKLLVENENLFFNYFLENLNLS